MNNGPTNTAMIAKIVWETKPDDDLLYANEAIRFLKDEFQSPGADDIWFDKYFEWKLGLQNPAGKGYLTIGVAKDKIIATVSLTKKRIFFNGKEYIGAEFGDAYCSNTFFSNLALYAPKEMDQYPASHYFNKSIFGRSAHETTIRALNNGVAILYGTPNQNAFPSWIKRLNHFNFEDHAIHAMIRPSSRFFISRYKHVRPWSFFVKYADTTLSYIVKQYSKIKAKEKIVMEKNIPADSELNELWQSTKPSAGFSLVRDAAYWNYRYFNHPESRYTTYTMRISGRLAGVITTCLQKVSHNKYRCCLVEWMIDGSCSLQQAIAEIIFRLRNEPIDHFVTYYNLANKNAKDLRANFFRQSSKISVTFYENELINPVSLNTGPFEFYMGNTDAI